MKISTITCPKCGVRVRKPTPKREGRGLSCPNCAAAIPNVICEKCGSCVSPFPLCEKCGCTPLVSKGPC